MARSVPKGGLNVMGISPKVAIGLMPTVALFGVAAGATALLFWQPAALFSKFPVTGSMHKTEE